MSRFKWYRTWRGGFWVENERVYDNHFYYRSWRKVNKKRFNESTTFLGESKEDWTKK